MDRLLYKARGCLQTRTFQGYPFISDLLRDSYQRTLRVYAYRTCHSRIKLDMQRSVKLQAGC